MAVASAGVTFGDVLPPEPGLGINLCIGHPSGPCPWRRARWVEGALRSAFCPALVLFLSTLTPSLWGTASFLLQV